MIGNIFNCVGLLARTCQKAKERPQNVEKCKKITTEKID